MKRTAGRAPTHKLTDSDRVLIALAAAADYSQMPTPYEEIVIRSWQLFPERFSLRNHPEFPDSSDQHKKLYGPLSESGWVVALKDKQFRLTQDGAERARVLADSLAGKDPHAVRGERLGRDDEQIIRNALRSDAYTKWSAGERDSIVDFDARTFFRFSVATLIPERQRMVRRVITAIERAIALSAEQSGELEAVANYLVERFGTELSLK